MSDLIIILLIIVVTALFLLLLPATSLPSAGSAIRGGLRHVHERRRRLRARSAARDRRPSLPYGCCIVPGVTTSTCVDAVKAADGASS